MASTSKYNVGIRFGLLAGLVYVLLLFIRYKFFGSTPPPFFRVAMVSYLVILMIYLLAGIARKKELGRYAEVREIFQCIFIVILIAEFSYVVFNFVYLKYVDSDFLRRFQENSLAYFRKMNYSSEQIDTEMKSIQVQSEMVKPGGLIKGFGSIVIVDSIFGFIFAFILKKKNPVVNEILPDSK
jgi:hypothetical protein